MYPSIVTCCFVLSIVMDMNKIYLLHYLVADGIYMKEALICPIVFCLNNMEIWQSIFFCNIYMFLCIPSQIQP